MANLRSILAVVTKKITIQDVDNKRKGEQKDMMKDGKKLLKLKYWREFLGLKQDDVAMLLGCKRPNYSKKETGAVDMRRGEMLLIQKEFNKLLKKKGQLELTLNDLFA